MKDISIGDAQRLTSPAPFALLSALKDDDSTNLMAVSWWTYLSNHPPMVGVSLSKKGLSGTLISSTGEFAVNIVSQTLAQAAIGCGRCSGRDTNKAAELGIAMEKATSISADIVSASRVVLECRLVSTADASDHVFYMAEIISAHGDSNVKQLFAYDGYSRLGIANEEI